MRVLNVWVVGVGVVLFGVALASHVYAQESIWIQLDIVSVVPDKLDDYRELQFDDVNPALQKAGVPWRNVFRTAEFGNSYEILTRATDQ